MKSYKGRDKVRNNIFYYVKLKILPFIDVAGLLKRQKQFIGIRLDGYYNKLANHRTNDII